jgi:hypothetical protein
MITRETVNKWYEEGQSSKAKTGLSFEYLWKELTKNIFNHDQNSQNNQDREEV